MIFRGHTSAEWLEATQFIMSFLYSNEYSVLCYFAAFYQDPLSVTAVAIERALISFRIKKLVLVIFVGSKYKKSRRSGLHRVTEKVEFLAE